MPSQRQQRPRRAIRGRLRAGGAAAAVLGVLTALLTVPAAQADTPAPPGTGLHRCATATDRCDGTIQVPLDFNDPSSAHITVGFAWVPRTDQTRPAAGTVMADPGGPAEAIGAVPLFQEQLGPVLQRHNLLVVDLRGFGTSSPLTCQGLDLLRPDTIPECVRELGDRAPWFATDQAAADLNAVRAALGVEQVTFYGSSYGTVLAQAFAARFPQHVTAVFLDSVVASDKHGYLPSLGFVDAVARGIHDLEVVCQPSRACRGLQGRPVQRLAALADRLRAHPDRQVPLGRLSAVISSLDDAVLGRELNAAIAAYLHDDPAPLRRLVAAHVEVVPPLDENFGQRPDAAAFLAYSCGDGSYPFARDATPPQRRQQLDAHYTRHNPVWPFTVAEATSMLGGVEHADWCVHWPTPRHNPPVPPGPTPDVPLLAIGGQLDTATPGADAVAVAARYPRGTGISIPFGGHASALGLGAASGCARDLLRAFITRPTHPVPDPGCSAETYRAVGPFPQLASEAPPAHGAGLTAGDAHLIGAAFATLADVVARRDPSADISADLTEEPGLRGGVVGFDDQARSIQLDAVRLVGDLAVSGQVTLAEDDHATADVRLSGADDRSARLHLRWQAFRAADTTWVTGTLDGRPFTASVPLHSPR